MDIEKCKKCKFYRLDTLADGTKEHYCCPIFNLNIIALSIPCTNRNKEDCKKILKAIKE